MKVLITGHRGFIGRRFYEKLTSIGHHVNGIGKNCEHFFINNNENYDLVLHFAACVEPKKEVKNIKTSKICGDLIIDSHMFNWADRTLPKHLVYFSSSSVYPVVLQKNPEYKLKESDVNILDYKEPDNIYGWTKLTGEYICNYLKHKGIKTHIFRPFSVYGEDQSETFLFPSFLNKIKRREDNFEIWGDGNQTRDFIYVDDVVNTVLEAIEKEYDKPLNIGTGIATSIKDLINLMVSISGHTPKNINYLYDKEYGCKYRCADITNLKKIYKNKFKLEDILCREFRKL